MSIESTETVVEVRTVLAPDPLSTIPLNVNAGMVWAPLPLKSTVLPVTVMVPAPGVNTAAMPIVPAFAKTLSPPVRSKL